MLILICYISVMDTVLKERLVNWFLVTTIWKFDQQLCLNLTNPNFAWFNSSTSDFFLMAVIAFSYLMMSILSVFYAYDMGFAIMRKISPNAVFIPSLSPTLYYSTKFISKVTLINIRYDMRSDLEIHCYNIFFQVLTNFKNQSISIFVLYKGCR